MLISLVMSKVLRLELGLMYNYDTEQCNYRQYGINPDIAKRIRQRMENTADDFETPTALAEDVAAAFCVDEWLDDETHPIWDWALEIKPFD